MPEEMVSNMKKENLVSILIFTLMVLSFAMGYISKAYG